MKEKELKIWFKKSFLLYIGIIGLFLIIGLSAVSLLAYIDYSEKTYPPQIINVNAKNAVYILTSDSPDGLTSYHDNNGKYYLYPIEGKAGGRTASKEHPAYVASSSENLEPFLNKKVKITGEVIWTNSLLKRPGFKQEKSQGKGAAVEIDSIQIVK